MTKYEHITFLPADTLALPNHLHTVDCPRCGWRQPVPLEYTDWQAIAEVYRKAHTKLLDSFFSTLAEAGEQFDVPLVEYFEACKQEQLELIRSILAELSNEETKDEP